MATVTVVKGCGTPLVQATVELERGRTPKAAVPAPAGLPRSFLPVCPTSLLALFTVLMSALW
jgi:hypothetical protein